jgi:hypothetical protein
MPLHLSQNRLYQVGAFLAMPVATYNFIVWFGNPEQKWETAYLKSFTGAIVCSIIFIILLILSFTRKDKIIVLCDRGQ